MIYKSKNLTTQGLPVWELDTDDVTVYYRNPETSREERFHFYHDYVKYHLHYKEDINPERIQKMVDNGEIYTYLSNFDEEVTDAINRQAQRFMDHDKEYLTALHSGNLREVEKIGNMCVLEAREIIFEAMVYV